MVERNVPKGILKSSHASSRGESNRATDEERESVVSSATACSQHVTVISETMTVDKNAPSVTAEHKSLVPAGIMSQVIEQANVSAAVHAALARAKVDALEQTRKAVEAALAQAKVRAEEEKAEAVRRTKVDVETRCRAELQQAIKARETQLHPRAGISLDAELQMRYKAVVAAESRLDMLRARVANELETTRLALESERSLRAAAEAELETLQAREAVAARRRAAADALLEDINGADADAKVGGDAPGRGLAAQRRAPPPPDGSSGTLTSQQSERKGALLGVLREQLERIVPELVGAGGAQSDAQSSHGSVTVSHKAVAMLVKIVSEQAASAAERAVDSVRDSWVKAGLEERKEAVLKVVDVAGRRAARERIAMVLGMQGARRVSWQRGYDAAKAEGYAGDATRVKMHTELVNASACAAPLPSASCVASAAPSAADATSNDADGLPQLSCLAAHISQLLGAPQPDEPPTPSAEPAHAPATVRPATSSRGHDEGVESEAAPLHPHARCAAHGSADGGSSANCVDTEVTPSAASAARVSEVSVRAAQAWCEASGAVASGAGAMGCEMPTGQAEYLETLAHLWERAYGADGALTAKPDEERTQPLNGISSQLHTEWVLAESEKKALSDHLREQLEECVGGLALESVAMVEAAGEAMSRAAGPVDSTLLKLRCDGAIDDEPVEPQLTQSDGADLEELAILLTRDAEARLGMLIQHAEPNLPPVIAGVAAGGAADRAGLKVGDEIIGVDGVRFSGAEYRRVTQLLPAGPEASFVLSVQRGAQRRLLPLESVPNISKLLRPSAGGETPALVFDPTDLDVDPRDLAALLEALPFLPLAPRAEDGEADDDGESDNGEGEEEEDDDDYSDTDSEQQESFKEEFTSMEIAAKRARHYLLGDPYETAEKTPVTAGELRAMQRVAVPLIQRRCRHFLKLREMGYDSDASSVQRGRGVVSPAAVEDRGALDRALELLESFREGRAAPRARQNGPHMVGEKELLRAQALLLRPKPQARHPESSDCEAADSSVQTRVKLQEERGALMAAVNQLAKPEAGITTDPVEDDIVEVALRMQTEALKAAREQKKLLAKAKRAGAKKSSSARPQAPGAEPTAAAAHFRPGSWAPEPEMESEPREAARPQVESKPAGLGHRAVRPSDID